MSKVETPKQLVQQYQLDAPPEKVWRAISLPEYRDRWLPNSALADKDPIASETGKEIHYRLRDDTPPYLESDVRLLIAPNGDGGTVLTIVHRLSDPRLQAANDNINPLMMAA